MNRMKSVALSLFIFTGFAVTGLSGSAQKKGEPVLMTIDGKPVYKAEFEAIFRKNYKKPQVEKADLEEYIDLFVKFRLKVAEAERLGLDTTAKFKSELAGYRKQLSKPYLVDRQMNDALIKEAYDRMQKDVRASHILVRVAPDAHPQDSLIAYNKAMELRKRVMAGEEFGMVASAKNGSEDPSASTNKGDLGFFTAFQMVYPFESAVYNLKVNDVSMPVRTQFGYHIIKKTAERPARGEVKVAHIMVRLDESANGDQAQEAETKINELWEKVKKGESFEELAKQFSDDRSSGQKGGELPMFGAGKMVEEFEEASFSLKNVGDISAPFKTQYGWHIVKKLEHKPVGELKDLEASIKQSVQRDSRSQKSTQSFISKLKSEHKFKDNSAKTLKAFIADVDTMIFYSEWEANKVKNQSAVLFSFAGGKVTAGEFATHLAGMMRKQKPEPIDGYVRRMYDGFVAQKLMNHEDNLLEKKHEDFRLLIKEYRDGILLFELTDQMVWSKGMKDSAGLAQFFEKNQKDYMWEDRVDAEIYWCANVDIAKKVQGMLNSGIPMDSIRRTINASSSLNVTIEAGKFERSKQSWLFAKGGKGITDIYELAAQNKIGIALVKDVMPAGPKLLNEVRGTVIARYQDFLEQNWVTELKARYKVSVNEDVLYSIK